MLDSFLGGIASSGALIALVSLIVGVWPKTVTALSTWLYSHVDPGRLPFESEMNRHWALTAKLDHQLNEIQKDTIKNTLISLMDQPGDQSGKVRYELSKLEALNATCWVVDEAKQYLDEHHDWRHHDT
jgi:hypothetical protein